MVQGFSEGSLGSFLIKSGVNTEGQWLRPIEVGGGVAAWIGVEVSCGPGIDSSCVDEKPDLACLGVEVEVSSSILRSPAIDRKALRSSFNTFTSPV